MRKNTLTAYATDEQKAKLKAISAPTARSHSDVLIELIEFRYREIYGETPVEHVA